jgi:hypothetical protein
MKPTGTTVDVDRQLERQPLWRRLLWLVAIWAASVLAVSRAADFVRLVIAAVGLGAHGLAEGGGNDLNNPMCIGAQLVARETNLKMKSGIESHAPEFFG